MRKRNEKTSRPFARRHPGSAPLPSERPQRRPHAAPGARLTFTAPAAAEELWASPQRRRYLRSLQPEASPQA